MADVFVSYKAEDRQRVTPLVRALEAEGLCVWWDEQIGGGAAWRHAIEAELNSAKCVIVVWSTRSIGPDGAFVQDEASRAQQRHVYVPVLIDKVRPPLGFGETQALPLIGWRGNVSDPRYHALLTAIHRLVNSKSRPETARPLDPTQLNRRTVLAGAGIAAAASLGGWLLFRDDRTNPSDSIAVLPFANLSGNPAQSYFSDGIAEEIRTALRSIAGLRVAGRTSSEAVRNEDARTAARKLGVANILTGSVRQSHSTIRVTAELIDGRSGLDRWGQHYDRAPGDAIKIQSDIAENVANALSAAFGTIARNAIAAGGTQNAVAHDLFLKAVALDQSSDREDTRRQALRLLDAAISRDPSYADAYARKAVLLRGLYGEYSRSPLEARIEGMRQAAANAERAIRLAPRLAAGHVALAIVRSAQLDLSAAFEQFKTAEALSPNDPQLLINYSEFLLVVGKWDQGLQMARRAVRLDPLNPQALNKEVLALFLAGRYTETIDAARRLLSLSPDYAEGLGLLGDTYYQLGRYADARREYAKMPADHPYRLASEAVVATRLGDRATADRLLRRLHDLYGDGASWQIADIHAQGGELDKALTALERGYAARDPGIRAIRVDPWLAPLRNEPRFKAVVRRLNFPS